MRPEERSRLLIGEDERVGLWVRKRIPTAPCWNGFYRAIGQERDGQLIVGVVYTDASPANVSAHIAAVTGSKWATPEFLRLIFGYPFNQLKVRRITCYVEDMNHRSYQLAEYLGFVRESVMERALVNGDMYVYRLFREDCKWI